MIYLNSLSYPLNQFFPHCRISIFTHQWNSRAPATTRHYKHNNKNRLQSQQTFPTTTKQKKKTITIITIFQQSFIKNISFKQIYITITASIQVYYFQKHHIVRHFHTLQSVSTCILHHLHTNRAHTYTIENNNNPFLPCAEKVKYRLVADSKKTLKNYIIFII